MTSPTDRRADLWAFFALTWASSVLFHLAGNTRLAPEWGRALLGLTAVAVLARPRTAWLAVPLSLAVLTNVWLEAPLLGNHWLLQGMIALVVLGAVLGSRLRPADAMVRLTGPVRVLLLVFYAFAALAKLNSDFFQPAVSCAVFYLRESADSWGLVGLVDGLSSGPERGVAIVVAAVELSIPLLLFLRRTRPVGVVVALVFHLVLALDRSHQFFDFSSVLAVCFLLFLDQDTRLRIVDTVGVLRTRLATWWESGPELLGWFALATLVGVVVFASGPGRWSAPLHLREAGVIVWIAVGLATILLVVHALRSGPVEPDHRLVGLARPRWLYLVPVLAVINGLTPYLELKSGHGWNMYSNLAMVDGESNHYLVRSGPALGDGHGRLVEITDSGGSSLAFYVDSPWLLPEVQLIDYLADRPGLVVEGVVDGEIVRYVGGAEGGRPEWRQKFVVFRSVDTVGSTSCQPSFGPAR